MANPPSYPIPPLAANDNKPPSGSYSDIAGSLVERLRALVDGVHSLHYNVSGQPAPSKQQAQPAAAQPAPPSPPGGKASLFESLLVAHILVSQLEDDIQSLVEKVKG